MHLIRVCFVKDAINSLGERIGLTTELRRTPVFPEYAKDGGKTIDFGGWDLPVQFSGIKEEHEATRTRAGLFDVSHMGEITVRGTKAVEFLQRMTTNDISKLTPKKPTILFYAMKMEE